MIKEVFKSLRVGIKRRWSAGITQALSAAGAVWLISASCGIACAESSPTQINNPSFDCAKARLPDEVAICNSAELSQLDQLANSGYRFLRRVYGQRANALAWPLLRERQACGANIACIKSKQLATIAYFQSLGAPKAVERSASTPYAAQETSPQKDEQPAQPNAGAEITAPTASTGSLDAKERKLASAATGITIITLMCPGYTPRANVIEQQAKQMVGAAKADKIFKAVGAEVALQMGRRDVANAGALMKEVSPIVDDIFNSFMSRKDDKAACHEIGETAVHNGLAERQ